MGAREMQTGEALDLNVGRWGNSLAVRLPAELARSLGITEGATLHVARNKDDTLIVSAQRARKPFDKAEWQKEARRHLASMTPSESVIREMRDGARY